MPVQPYDNCPCGSGKKFKWCCQKVAKHGERAEQMLEKGQVAGGLQAIEEGLALDPQNAWLRMMKVQVLLGTHNHDAAEPLIQDILRAHPGNRPVLTMRLQHELAHADAAAAVATMQQVLDATAPGDMEESLVWLVILGRALGELGSTLAALAHLRVAAPVESTGALSPLISLQGQMDLSPWVRDAWQMRPAPAGNQAAERWTNAIALATVGRWQRAASILEAITVEQPENAAAWFNLGLCQGWLALDEQAADSLARSARLESDPESAVDSLALALSIDPRESAQTVDVVQIRYAILDHSKLIQRLKDHPRFQVHVLDARQGELGEGVKDEFHLLNKDALKDIAAATMENLPAIVGVVRTRGRELELEFAEPVADDPRAADTVAAAGDSIDPDGSRSVAGTIPVSRYRLRRLWGMPPSQSMVEVRRIRKMLHENNYRETWVGTPLGWLENRTPHEAAQIPELRPIVRAAILLNEYACEANSLDVNFDELRRELGIDPEPILSGEGLDIDRVPVGRLRRVNAETLSLPQLIALFDKATVCAVPIATQHAASSLVSHQAEHQQFDHTFAFRSLIEIEKKHADRTAAERWLAQARRFDSEIGETANKSTWDITEWELSFQFDPIQVWGARLSQLVIRLGGDKEASKELMLALVRLGIVRVTAHPSDPNCAVLDTRILDQILAQFVADRSGLDLSPVGGQPGKIWTPGDQGVRESAIVLPGQELPNPPRSKLVIPGS